MYSKCLGPNRIKVCVPYRLLPRQRAVQIQTNIRSTSQQVFSSSHSQLSTSASHCSRKHHQTKQHQNTVIFKMPTILNKSRTAGRPRPYNAADRFIPNRTASEAINHIGTAKLDLVDSIHSLDLDDDEDNDKSSYTKPSPNTVKYKASIASACEVSLNKRILAFKPAPPESSRPIELRAQYNHPLKPASAVSAERRRRILTAPERVLDAPNIVDDYYLNLLDWSCNNQVAIGLGQSVYVWSAETGEVSSLLESSSDTYISSLKWSGDGAYVSVGLGTGEVQIWDVEEQTKLRSMFGHESRVSVMGKSPRFLSFPISQLTSSKAGTNICCPPAHAMAGCSTTMSVSRSTRLPTSNLTQVRSVAWNGAPMAPSWPRVETTTWSPFGMLAACSLPSSRKPTTTPQSRPLPGVHGNTTFWRLAVVVTTNTSTSGTQPPVLASTPSTPAAKSLV